MVSESPDDGLAQRVSRSVERRVDGVTRRSAQDYKSSIPQRRESLDAFANVTVDDGRIGRSDFDGVFFELCEREHQMSASDSDLLRVVLGGLFDLFDNDDDSIDFTELSSGISILCDGTLDEKAFAAFSLFDYNGDNFITLDEMNDI